MNAAIANDRNTDHVDLLMSRVESSADATARALVNTVLSPRFYTPTLPLLTGWTSSPSALSGM